MSLLCFQAAGIIELHTMSGGSVQFKSSYNRDGRKERKGAGGREGGVVSPTNRVQMYCARQRKERACQCRRQVELGVHVEAGMIERPGWDD